MSSTHIHNSKGKVVLIDNRNSTLAIIVGFALIGYLVHMNNCNRKRKREWLNRPEQQDKPDSIIIP